jgi:hypothetical protein
MDAPGATTVKRARDAVLTSGGGGVRPSSRLRDQRFRDLPAVTRTRFDAPDWRRCRRL